MNSRKRRTAKSISVAETQIILRKYQVLRKFSCWGFVLSSVILFRVFTANLDKSVLLFLPISFGLLCCSFVEIHLYRRLPKKEQSIEREKWSWIMVDGSPYIKAVGYAVLTVLTVLCIIE